MDGGEKMRQLYNAQATMRFICSPIGATRVRVTSVVASGGQASLIKLRLVVSFTDLLAVGIYELADDPSPYALLQSDQARRLVIQVAGVEGRDHQVDDGHNTSRV